MSNLKRIFQTDENSEGDSDQAKRIKLKNAKFEALLAKSNVTNSIKPLSDVENKQKVHINPIQKKHQMELDQLNKENENLLSELNRKQTQIQELKSNLNIKNSQLKNANELIENLKDSSQLQQQVSDLKQEASRLKQENEELISRNLTDCKKLEVLEKENLNLKLEFRDLKQKVEKFESAHLKHKKIINDYCDLKIEHKIQIIQLEEKYKNELEKMKLSNLN